MKRLVLIFGLFLACVSPAVAQDVDEDPPFTHWGAGISVGTTALGISVSTTINPYLGLRAGVNVWPIFKLGSKLHLGFRNQERNVEDYRQFVDELNERLSDDEQISPTVSDIMEIKMKPKLTAGHVMLDYYPFPFKSNFRLTVGAHIGTGTLVNLHNRRDGILIPITFWNRAMINPDCQDVVEKYDLRPIGVKLGDYFIAPDAEGNINARIRVSGFRPYLGLGFGRSVPRKRIGCQVDLGLQFWGSPKVMVNGQVLEAEHAGDDLDDILSIVSRIKVFPVLNIRLVGRIL